MNRKISIIIILIFSLFFSSCSIDTRINEDANRLKEMESKVRYFEDLTVNGALHSYPCDINTKMIGSTVTDIDAKKSKFIQANGIEHINGKIYVADSEKNEVIIFDKEANRVGELAKPGDFSKPIDIFYNKYNKEIFVLDAGNNQVKVFDLDHKLLRTVNLDKMRTSYYNGISVDKDNNIFISVSDSHKKDKLTLCRIDKEGKLYYYPRFFIGRTFENDGNIYAFDTSEVLLYKNSETISFGDGRNNLYIIKGDNMEKIAEIPDNYSASSMQMVDGRVYSIPAFNNRLDVFKLGKDKLDYEHSMDFNYFNIETHNMPFAYDLTVLGNDVYITFSGDKRGKICRISSTK